jgi:hypothetical protein
MTVIQRAPRDIDGRASAVDHAVDDEVPEER